MIRTLLPFGIKVFYISPFPRVENVPSTKNKGNTSLDPSCRNISHKVMTCLSKSWVAHFVWYLDLRYVDKPPQKSRKTKIKKIVVNNN